MGFCLAPQVGFSSGYEAMTTTTAPAHLQEATIADSQGQPSWLRVQARTAGKQEVIGRRKAFPEHKHSIQAHLEVQMIVKQICSVAANSKEAHFQAFFICVNP